MGDEKMKELYEKKVANLKLSDIKDDDEEIKKILDNFSENFLLLPQEWETRLKIERVYNTNYNNSKNERYEFYCKIYKPILKKALSDFYSEALFYSEWLNPWFRNLFIKEEKPFDRILNARYPNSLLFEHTITQKRELTLKEALSFPHSKLSVIFQCYREYSDSPMTKDLLQMYEKNKRHFKKIEAVKDDLNEWFNAVLEVEDERFIIQNVECKIAENPFNSNLWKLYIKYLKTKNLEAANEVCFRYRKLFADDKIMESEFPEIKDVKNSVEEYEYLKNMKYKYASAENKISDVEAPLYFNFEIPPKSQKFPFRSTVIHYLMKNDIPEVTQKLYYTCKYFFFKLQEPICHFIYTGFKNTEFLKHSLVLDIEKLNSTNVTNLSISNSFRFVPSALPLPETGVMSKLLPKIAACYVRFLEIFRQNLTYAEYYFLTKAGRVEKLCFCDVTITDEKNNNILLEQSFYSIPNAYYINALKIQISPETGDFFRNLKRSTKKIDYMLLQIMNAVSKELKHEDFVNFLKKHVQKAYLAFSVRDETTTLLIEAINAWKEKSAGYIRGV